MASEQQQQQQQQQGRSAQVGALFGLGRAGKIHYGNVAQLPRVRIKYIVDACQEAALEYVAEDPGVCVLAPEQEDRVFADADVTFCVVSSPTFTHEAIIRKSIAAGKHIFCEKPVAKSIDAMVDCYRLARQRGVQLHCSFNRRYDPSFNALRDRIPEVVGSVHTVRTCSRDSPYPSIEYLSTSGGIYHDCGVHDIDVACWLLGDWPESVFAVGACHRDELRQFDDSDTVVMVLRFPRDRIATIELSRHSSFGYDQRVEVHGSKGMLASNNVRDRAVTASTAAGVTEANIQFSFPQRYAEAYIQSMRVFLAAIAGDSSSSSKLVSPSESVNVSCIAAAAELSARTGQPVAYSPATL